LITLLVCLPLSMLRDVSGMQHTSGIQLLHSLVCVERTSLCVYHGSLLNGSLLLFAIPIHTCSLGCVSRYQVFVSVAVTIRGTEHATLEHVPMFKLDWRIFSSITITFFAYTCHVLPLLSHNAFT
jgi:hypothetical protein